MCKTCRTWTGESSEKIEFWRRLERGWRLRVRGRCSRASGRCGWGWRGSIESTCCLTRRTIPFLSSTSCKRTTRTTNNNKSRARSARLRWWWSDYTRKYFARWARSQRRSNTTGFASTNTTDRTTTSLSLFDRWTGAVIGQQSLTPPFWRLWDDLFLFRVAAVSQRYVWEMDDHLSLSPCSFNANFFFCEFVEYLDLLFESFLSSL